MPDLDVASWSSILTNGGLGVLAIWLIIKGNPAERDKFDALHRAIVKDLSDTFSVAMREALATFTAQNDKRDALFRETTTQLVAELVGALKGLPRSGSCDDKS